jgi:glycosyltransferase involved in cell wall biosynthesis
MGKALQLVSIIIPAYNERAYIKRLVTKVIDVDLPMGLTKEIIIIDDGSQDGTDEIIKSLVSDHPGMITAIFQELNQGKGAALSRGIAEASGDYIVFQDADLEYDPNDYSVLLEPLIEGYADVVYGSRFAARKMRRVFNYHHALGNKFLTHLSNFTTGLDLTDMETCYKAFRSDILKTIPIRSKRFGIEPEITTKVAKRHCRVYEVPISYRGRSYSEGKKIGWKDGVQAIFTILKYTLIDDCFNEAYGSAILHSLSHARRFNRWMVKLIEPYLGMRIVEIGAGIGNISRQLPQREKLVVTDVDPTYLYLLDRAFSGNEIVRVERFDLTDDGHIDDVGRGANDTVVCLNVLEHIEDEEAAVARMKQLLEKDGRLILLVPQHQWLYGSYDELVGHYRRYSKAHMRCVMNKADLEIEYMGNFNFLSIPGWWFNACLLKSKKMSRLQLKLYDTIVPIMRMVEYALPLPGLSLICVAKIR